MIVVTFKGKECANKNCYLCGINLEKNTALPKKKFCSTSHSPSRMPVLLFISI